MSSIMGFMFHPAYMHNWMLFVCVPIPKKTESNSVRLVQPVGRYIVSELTEASLCAVIVLVTIIVGPYKEPLSSFRRIWNYLLALSMCPESTGVNNNTSAQQPEKKSRQYCETTISNILVVPEQMIILVLYSTATSVKILNCNENVEIAQAPTQTLRTMY